MVTHSIEFDRVIGYEPAESGITVEATIGFSDKSVSLTAKVDTGASICVFQREHGEELGLEIETGLYQRIATATGSFTAFGFRVGLSVAGLNFNSLVYFASDVSIQRNVLGRYGWLELVKLGLVDYEGKLYLSRYF